MDSAITVPEEVQFAEFRELHRRAMEKIRVELQSKALPGVQIEDFATGWDRYGQLDPDGEPEMWAGDIGHVVMSVTMVDDQPWWLFGRTRKVRASRYFLSTVFLWWNFGSRRELLVNVESEEALAVAQKFLGRIGESYKVKVEIIRRYVEAPGLANSQT